MPTFSSIKQLETYLKKAIQDSMEDVGRDVEQVVRDNLEKEVYQPFEPEEYIRTRELMNSLTHKTKKNGNEATVEVKNDEDMFYDNYAPNQHMNVTNGNDLPLDALVDIVNNGKAGRIFGEGAWTKPRPFMTDSQKDVEKKKIHVKGLKKSLKNKGLNVRG